MMLTRCSSAVARPYRSFGRFWAICCGYAEHPAITIDGKEMRRSFDKAPPSYGLICEPEHCHRLCSWCAAKPCTKCQEWGEIQICELIEMLDVRGITITADALHCQQEACDLIVGRR